MASIDDRVVSMKFDNKSFEDNVGSTISTLDKLKSKLDFTGSQKGMQDLEAASSKFQLDGMATAVEGIASKFTLMGGVAFSVLNTVVSQAVSAGERLGKSLSLDQMISGFQEYETNMGSIQTIMANTSSKGTSLKEVNAALDELNAYSDKTIYNFGEMAKNIGTFTAAGIDLNTSVTSIKGIANLAAVSGSNAEQAASAMYQLSQALAAGTVKLMDWNSVGTSGMGGEVFQKSLWDTAKAMGTIKDIPMGQTFEQWKKAGNSFRESLKDGWLTSKVLTTTLSQFTGEMTDAQLKSLGFNKKQIADIQKLAVTAGEAATKIKTFTQLMSTIKEAIGSGWSASFRIVLGDFEEAKSIFTQIYDVVGGIVGRSADARNTVLQDWKNLGGRSALIVSLTKAAAALGSVISTVKHAFADIFPPMTGKKLFELTRSFQFLVGALTPSKETLYVLKRAFEGLFSVLAIGWEVIKQGAKFINGFITILRGSPDPNTGVLGFLGRLGLTLKGLKLALVDAGGIEKFFKNLSDNLSKFASGLNLDNFKQKFVTLFTDLRDKIASVFSSSSLDTSPLEQFAAKIKERFSPLITLVNKIADAWDWLIGKINTVRDYLGRFGDFIKKTFGDIPQKIADVFAKTDYSQVLDTLNTGLFAGLVVLVKKFFSDGFKFDVGGGLFDKISKSFEQLTGVLKAMETKVKTDALVKIATAVGILAASLFILALIDSAKLTAALVAAAVGLTGLVGAMKILDKEISSGKDARKLATVALGILLISMALSTLAVAMKIFATMSWADLAKGLTAVTASLIVIGETAKLLSNTNGLVKAGIGIFAIALAMNVLAGAIKLFSMMSWSELGKGLATITAALIGINVAMKLVPNETSMIKSGLGILAIAFAMNILAGAIKLFSMMSWKELNKGLGTIAASLTLIGLAMNVMPSGPNMVAQGVGLVLIGLSLMAIAKAMQTFGGMSWKEIGKGLTAIAASLAILAVALNLMTGTMGGAIALGVAALSLMLLKDVVVAFAGISWGDLIKGLAGIALVLGVIAAAGLLIEPILPALLGLGLALLLIGAGFALFGLGANLVATAFSIIVTSATQGLDTLSGAIDLLIKDLPPVLEALAQGIIRIAQRLVEALPGIIKGLSKSIDAILQLIIDNMPKFGAAVLALIDTLLNVLVQSAPKIIAAGFALLMGLLQGISDNIEQITNTVVDIILKFITALTDRLPDIIAKGAELLATFLKGIADNLGKVISAAGDVIGSFIKGIGDLGKKIVTAGADALVSFLDGIASAIPKIAGAITDVITEFLHAIATETPKVVDAFFQMFIDLFNGLADTIRARSGELGKALGNLVSALVDGIGNALKEAIKQIANDLFPGLGYVVDGVLSFFHIASPSKLFYWIGDMLMQGFSNGIFENFNKPIDSLESGSNKMLTTVTDTVSKISDALSMNIDANPTITPVLDLTGVTRDAARLNDMIASTSNVGATLSIQSANLLASATLQTASNANNQPQPVVKEVKFEQNNYSPEALTTAQIYRQTRSQISLAKEELALL